MTAAGFTGTGHSECASQPSAKLETSVLAQQQEQVVAAPAPDPSGHQLSGSARTAAVVAGDVTTTAAAVDGQASVAAGAGGHRAAAVGAAVTGIAASTAQPHNDQMDELELEPLVDGMDEFDW
jgi:hypothetical protein